jgi:hypothetical protein
MLPLRGFRSFLGFPIRAVQLANLPRCLRRHAFGAAGVDRGAAHPIAQGLRVAPSLAETAFIPPKCVGTTPGRFICRSCLVAIIPVDQGLWVDWQCRSRQCETAPPSDGSGAKCSRSSDRGSIFGGRCLPTRPCTTTALSSAVDGRDCSCGWCRRTSRLLSADFRRGDIARLPEGRSRVPGSIEILY